MESKEATLEEDELSEIHLRKIEKSIHSLVEAHGDDYPSDEARAKQISNLLGSTLSLASNTQCSPTHRVVACNVLCGLAEQCMHSAEKQTRYLVCNASFYLSLLDVYLERFDISKGKSMKQVLGTLLKIFRATREDEQSNDVEEQTLAKIFDILFLSQSHVRAKPALNFLSSILSRGLLSVSRLIDIFKSGIDYTGDGINLATNKRTALQAFLRNILSWMYYMDLASASGQLLSTLIIIEKRESDVSNGHYDLSPRNHHPVWAVPIVEAIARSPDDVRLMKAYVFPTIFKIDLKDYWDFLQYLGIHQYISSDAGSLITGVESNVISKETNEMLLFTALQVGKATSLIRESAQPDSRRIEIQNNTVWIPEQFLGQLLSSPSSEVRLSGLSLLTTSAYATRPLSPSALKYLQAHLPAVFADIDANARSETQSLVQSLVDRLRAISANLSRKIQSEKFPRNSASSRLDLGAQVWDDSAQGKRPLYDAHKSFVSWFVQFLVSELVPTASYQRHVSALKSLKILARSGVDSHTPTSALAKQAKGDVSWPFTVTIFGPEASRLLYDLLLDPFDDVRQNAVGLLQLHIAQSSSDVVSLLQNSLGRANELMLDTGRLDHADGVARLFSLLSFCHSGRDLIVRNDMVSANSGKQWRAPLFDVLEGLASSLEKGIQTSRSNFAFAVSTYPIHGLFTSLKYCLEQAPSVVELEAEHAKLLATLLVRITYILIDVWHAVRDVLCDDAPEGFMPEEIENDTDLTTKDVLSYSWRALKEASLLLRQLVMSDIARVSNTDKPRDRLELLGDLCFEQLAELRHRGAFSTVAQTFMALCQRCTSDTNLEAADLVKKWYRSIISLVREKGSVTTRRSAGIPALMVAVLSADPASGLFEDAMIDLKSLSSLRLNHVGDNELPQVHALNCLKAIFIATKLSTRSDQYIAGALDIAATALGSSIWAIRNCGLMLFRSLVDRLIGPDETLRAFSPNTSLISWDRYPGLIESLLNLLRNRQRALSVGSDAGAEAVFLVLDLFRRTPGPASYRAEIRELVLEATCKPHWHVRQIAAQAFAASCQLETAIIDVETLLAFDMSNPNVLHGRLTCVDVITGFILSKTDPTDQGSYVYISQLLRELTEATSNIFSRTLSPFALSPYVESCNSLGKFAFANLGQNKEYAMTCVNKFVSLSSTLQRFVHEGSHLQSDPGFKRSVAVNNVLKILIQDQLRRLKVQYDAAWEIYKILELADPDTANYVIESIARLFLDQNKEPNSPYLLALTQFITTTTVTSVTARQTLAKLLDISDFEANDPIFKRIRASFASFKAADHFLQSTSPSLGESNLQLWSHSLASRRIDNGKWHYASLIQETEMWLEAVRCGLDEWNDFSMRQAAAHSLKAIARVVPLQPVWPGHLDSTFYFAAYDALVDDDDDIRTFAAEVITTSLSRSKNLHPPAACHAVYKHLVGHHAASRKVLLETITRVTGAKRNNSNNSFLPTVQEQLEEYLRPDNSLFAVEKQNLYMDPAKEAEMWAQVLKRLSLTNTPTTIIDSFAQWVMHGLETLRAKAESGRDGPLGWTSKPDVFALGMRVIHAADVLMEWRRGSSKVKIRGSEIRKALAEFAEAGRANELHETWMRHIEIVLARSIALRVGRVGQVLGAIPVLLGTT